MYRKAVHTDSYLNFQLHLSKQLKESILRSLVERGEVFSADDSDKLAEPRRVDKALKMNNYPDRCIHTTRRKMSIKHGDIRTKEQRAEKPLVVLPYVKGVTERITHVLKPHARVSTKSGRNLQNMLVMP